MRVKEVRDDLEWRSLEHAYSPQQAEIAREDAAVVQRLRSDEELAWMVPNEQDDDAETVVSALFFRAKKSGDSCLRTLLRGSYSLPNLLAPWKHRRDFDISIHVIIRLRVS